MYGGERAMYGGERGTESLLVGIRPLQLEAQNDGGREDFQSGIGIPTSIKCVTCIKNHCVHHAQLGG